MKEHYRLTKERTFGYDETSFCLSEFQAGLQSSHTDIEPFFGKTADSADFEIALSPETGSFPVPADLISIICDGKRLALL